MKNWVYPSALILILLLVSGCTYIEKTEENGVYGYNCEVVTEKYFIQENKLFSKESGLSCEIIKEDIKWEPPGGYSGGRIESSQNLIEVKLTSECSDGVVDFSSEALYHIIVDENNNLFDCIAIKYG